MEFKGGNASFQDWVIFEDDDEDAVCKAARDYVVSRLDYSDGFDLPDEILRIAKEAFRKEFNQVLDRFFFFDLEEDGVGIELNFSGDADASNPKYFMRYEDMGRYYAMTREQAGKTAANLRNLADALERNAE